MSDEIRAKPSREGVGSANAREFSCASGPSCRESVRTPDGRREPAEILVRRGLCQRCERAVLLALRAIGSDYDRLGGALSDRRVRGELVSGTPDPSMPLNGAVVALRSTLGEWGEAALWMCAEGLGIDVRSRHKAKGWPVRDGPVITQAARVLPRNLRLLLSAPPQPVSVWQTNGNRWQIEEYDGIDVALKLATIHRQVAGLLGEANPRRRLSMPCPVFDCGRHTLGIDNGESDVTCTSCGGRWSELEYDWLARMLVDDHRRTEIEMLKWLLAQAEWRLEVTSWLLAERDHRLRQVDRLAYLPPDDLVGIDAVAMTEVLREVLGEEVRHDAVA